jgi:hypothetical protein
MIDPLGTDSCRGTVPMEPPMSNGSMWHREPKSEIDDTGHILQGASCTIAVRAESTTTATGQASMRIGNQRRVFASKPDFASKPENGPPAMHVYVPRTIPTYRKSYQYVRKLSFKLIASRVSHTRTYYHY